MECDSQLFDSEYDDQLYDICVLAEKTESQSLRPFPSSSSTLCPVQIGSGNMDKRSIETEDGYRDVKRARVEKPSTSTDTDKIKRTEIEKHVSSLGVTSNLLPTRQLLPTYNQERQASVTRCQWIDDDPRDRDWVTCPLCAIEVPTCFINEHYKSNKHKIYAKIADVALGRVQKLLHYSIVGDIDKAESLYFCPQCVISLNPKDRQSHEKTVVHKKALTVDKFLYDFYVLYANDDRKSDIARECEATVVVKSNITENIEVKTNDSVVNSNKNVINSDPITNHQMNDSKMIKVEKTSSIPIKSEVDNSNPYDNSQFCTLGTKKNQIYCKTCNSE